MKTTTLTRPQRRTNYAVLMWIAWLIVAVFMLGGTSNSYRLQSTNGLVTETRSHQYGVPKYLFITESATGTNRAALPPPTVTWELKAVPSLFIACVLIAWAFVCRRGYVWYVNRARVEPSLCDECGYNMTGITSARCPECGTVVAR